MAKSRPEGLKGWPKSWYVNGNEENGDLRCIAPGCPMTFQTEYNVDLRLQHVGAWAFDKNADLRFTHTILRAMCEVNMCPICKKAFPVRYKDPPYNFNFVTDIRPLLKHVRELHGGVDLTDIHKFIGWIRDHRDRLFGATDLKGAIALWKEVDEYHRRKIKKESDYKKLMNQMASYGLIAQDGDLLGHVNELCRDIVFPGNPEGAELEACKKYYPVDRDAFLAIPRLQPKPGTTNVVSDMSYRYRLGHF